MGKVLTTSKSSPVGRRSALNKKFSSSAIALALATVFSSVSVPADAAGLGRLTVKSALGQPLRAEVEVTSLTDDEASSLAAKLARPDAFRQAGLEFNPALTSLRFNVQRQGTGAIVQITSSRPVNEPFVDLLVELTWSSGKFVREYTFLLDPPELRVAQPQPIEGGASSSSVVTPRQAPNSAIAPAAANVATPSKQAAADAARAAAVTAAASSQAASPAADAKPAPAQPAAAQAAATPAPTAAPQAATSRVVQRGDTLAKIAKEFQPGAGSLNQAMVAIYRKNSGAFFGSVHQLRAGTTLEMPTATELAAVTSADATREIRASNEAWRAYRAKIAQAATETVEAPAQTAESNAAVGSISAATEEAAPETATTDELRLSRDATGASEAGGSATAAGQADAAAVSAAESGIARDAALRNAQGRVSELERNVADLQRLLELKNKQLADLGNQVADLETTAEAAAAQATTGVVTDTSADASPAQEDTATETVSSESTPVETEAAATESTGATEAADAVSDAETTEAAASVALPSVEQAGDAVADTAETIENAAETAGDAVADAADAAGAAAQSAVDAASGAQAPAATETTQPTPAPIVQSESMVDTVMNTVTSNPIVPIGAAALIGIGGFFAWRRRKSKGSEERFEDTLGGDDAFAANSLFGTTGGQDVDTSNSLFNTNAVSDTSVDVHTTEVDPIAEAEVYIAYGREAQAEEILKEALKRQPDRQAIRLKLLEIYAGRKDAAAYGAVAREMYDGTGGQNEEWPKVITMGLSIDPENPLYTGDAEVDGASDLASAAGVAAGAAGAAGLVDALSDDDGATDNSPMSDAIDTSMQSLTADQGETLMAGMSAELEADDDIDGLDFDLDINTEIDTSMEISDTTADISANTESDALGAALEANVEMPTLELDDPSSPTEPAAIADMDDLSVEIPSIDTIRGQPSNEASDVDLASIGLDLSSNPESAPAGDGAKWQEMATKLDLASAYEEIGDKEGARELLDEVVKDGDNAQQQKARAMLSKIS